MRYVPVSSADVPHILRSGREASGVFSDTDGDQILDGDEDGDELNSQPFEY